MFSRSHGRAVPGRPGSEAVEVEETLGALDRARRFGYSKLSLQRLVFVHELVECAHDVGYDATVQYLLPIVQNLASDPEVLVRQSLMKHFCGLAGFLIQSDPEKGYEKVARTLLPTAKLLLSEKAADVRQSAIEAFTALASHLRAGDCGDQVLMPVIALSQSNDDEEARSTAVQLLGGLAEALGPDLCQQFVGVQLEAFCEDQSFRVRKAAAGGFAEVSRMLGGAGVLKRLVPAFAKLTKDVHWGVKKAAAESLVSFALNVNVEQRPEAFVPMVQSLLADPSRFVSMAMLQQLGYFLGALEVAESVPLALLNQYLQVIQQSKANPDAADMGYHCAFTFASVVRTMGRSQWTMLKDGFPALCTDTQSKTRKAMAASVHVVAQTLGADLVEQEILPVFEQLLQDAQLEVRQAATKNVAGLLNVAPRSSVQRRLLQSLQTGMGKVDSWRARHLTASQLGPICSELAKKPPAGSEEEDAGKTAGASPSGALTSTKDATWRAIVPLFLQLCGDGVAQVREAAARSAAGVLRAAAPELFVDPGTCRPQEEGSSGASSQQPGPLGSNNLVRHLIRNFARSKIFRNRMIFIRMCDAIIREAPLHVFSDLFMRPMLRLSNDPVKNVRLYWVVTVLPHLRKVGRLGQKGPVLAAAVRMRRTVGDAEVHRLLDEAKLPEVAEDEIAALLARESDPDESDGCDLVAGKEGGTGNSSECSEVDAEFEEERSEPKEAPPATRKDEPTEAAPQKAEETALPLPTSSSMARQTSPQVKVASPVLGPAASPGHDAVEDGLVQQLEIERDLDAAFSDRRLLAEAEATDPEKLGITRGYREVESPAALPAVSPAPAAPTPPPSDVKVETPAVQPAAAVSAEPVAVSAEPAASGAASTDSKDAPAELPAPAPSAHVKEAPVADAPAESPAEAALAAGVPEEAEAKKMQTDEDG